MNYNVWANSWGWVPHLETKNTWNLFEIIKEVIPLLEDGKPDKTALAYFDKNREKKDSWRRKNYWWWMSYIEYKITKPANINYISKDWKEFSGIYPQSITVLEDGQIIIQLKIQSEKWSTTKFSIKCNDIQELHNIVSTQEFKSPTFSMDPSKNNKTLLWMEWVIHEFLWRFQEADFRNLKDTRILWLLRGDDNPHKLIRPTMLRSYPAFSSNVKWYNDNSKKAYLYRKALQNFETLILELIEKLKTENYQEWIKHFMENFWEKNWLNDIIKTSPELLPKEQKQDKARQQRHWFIYGLFNIIRQTNSNINPVLKIRAIKILSTMDRQSNKNMITILKKQWFDFDSMRNPTTNPNEIKSHFVYTNWKHLNAQFSATNIIRAFKNSSNYPLLDIALSLLSTEEFYKVWMEILNLLADDNYRNTACQAVWMQPIWYTDSRTLTIDASKINRNVILKHEELIASLLAAENDKAAMAEELKMFREKLEEARSKIDELQKSIESTNKEMIRISAENAKLRKQKTTPVAPSTPIVNPLQKSLEEKTAEIERLKKRIDGLNKNFEILEATKNGEISNLKQQISELSTLTNDANQLMSWLNQDIAELRTEKNTLAENNEWLRNENEWLRSQIGKKISNVLWWLFWRKAKEDMVKETPLQKSFRLLNMNADTICRFEKADRETKISWLRRLLSLHRMFLEKTSELKIFPKFLAAVNIIADHYQLDKFVSEDAEKLPIEIALEKIWIVWNLRDKFEKANKKTQSLVLQRLLILNNDLSQKKSKQWYPLELLEAVNIITAKYGLPDITIGINKTEKESAVDKAFEVLGMAWPLKENFQRQPLQRTLVSIVNFYKMTNHTDFWNSRDVMNEKIDAANFLCDHYWLKKLAA